MKTEQEMKEQLEAMTAEEKSEATVAACFERVYSATILFTRPKLYTDFKMLQEKVVKEVSPKRDWSEYFKLFVAESQGGDFRFYTMPLSKEAVEIFRKEVAKADERLADFHVFLRLG